MGDNRLVEIDGTILGMTELAVQFDDGGTVVYVPKSLIEDWDEDTERGPATLMVPYWFCYKEGLI